MEPIKLTFLGTSGSVPQKDRNFASAVLNIRGKTILFDCPEGTQRQLMHSEHSMMKIEYIFISHLHADHFLGLFGWIATMTLNQRQEKLVIFSPKGGKEKILKIMKEVIYPSFTIEFKELKKGIVLEEDLFEVKAFPLNHEIPCFGFVFQENDKKGEFNRKKAEALGIPAGPLYAKLVAGEKIKVGTKTFTQKDVMDYSKGRKGRKIVYVSDTLPVKESIGNAKGANILIHEATFIEEQSERAKESMHSTAKQAAQIAKKAGVKKLILMHFSARKNEEETILKEAKKEFKETIAARDFDTILL